MKTVLIIDDEESAARQVAEVCAGMGLRAEALHNGQEAVDRASRATPDLVVASIGTPKVDGLSVAQEIRSRAGAGVPFLFVSATHKSLPRDVANAQFLAKPFQKTTLQSTISSLLGMHAPARAAGHGHEVRRGSLAELAGGAVLIELFRARATGVLEVMSGQVKRKVYLQGGQLRYAASNVRSENLGGMQVAAGTLPEPTFQAAVAMAREKRLPLHEALVQSGAMKPNETQDGLRLQTFQVAAAVARQREGTFEFATGAVGTTPETRQPLVMVVLDGLKNSVDAIAARNMLSRHSGRALGRSPELEKELFAVKNAFPGEVVTPMCNGRTTVGEAIARMRELDLPLLYALTTSGLAPLAGVEPPRAAAGPEVKAAGSPGGELDEVFGEDPADSGVEFTQQEKEARVSIFAERRRVANASHYEVLGVDSKAAADVIKRAYLVAAKRWHADGFAGLKLGSAEKLLGDIFSRVGEAQSILQDANKRGDYDIYLDRKAKGLPTDVAAILRAESVFTNGTGFLKRGKFPEAEAAFREATSLNFAEAEFWAYLGMAIYKNKGSAGASEARASIEKALALTAELPTGLIFSAAISRGEGDFARAEKLLEQVLEKEPNNAAAEREMNALQAAKSEAQPKGGAKKLLSRLFGK